ncbi:MAG: [acyl-carrier-protein] S-malonyltransferase [Gammaproteobacteria bacterium]|nr:MAG: [acyl-carrier-protein] S-malonyltransferase [Gammaproteobacteria bacterium]
MSFAALFPGQGSQSVGMLAELMDSHPVVAQTLAEAGDALGIDLAGMVREGPEELLNRTENTQPAMLASGVAVWRAFREAGGPLPAAMAGHSLGEFTALVCAGAMDFADAVRLVAERGRLMQAAVPEGQGAMAAILGLDDDVVRQVCADAAQGQVVEAVNYNSPGQVVIAGDAEAVERAIELAGEAGAKRAVRLPVSVPSHCSLMQPAAEQLRARLEEVDIRTPEVPVIHNVDVAAHSDPAEIRDLLARQLHNPVRWVETVQKLAAEGNPLMLELGPGKVLMGLIRRIDRKITCIPVQDPAGLEKALEAVKGE